MVKIREWGKVDFLTEIGKTGNDEIDNEQEMNTQWEKRVGNDESQKGASEPQHVIALQNGVFEETWFYQGKVNDYN